MTTKFGNHLLSQVPQEKKIKTLFFTCWASLVVKNPPAIAADMGSGPGLGGSHTPWSGWTRAPQLLSLCSIAREPPLLRPCAAAAEGSVPWSPCSPTAEAAPARGSHTATGERPPLSATRGKSAQPWRPSTTNK